MKTENYYDHDFHSSRFESLQILRGVAAFFIILEHLSLFNCGAFGVDIFFCLSGFMIMHSTHKSTEYFLRKRFIRTLPLYYFMTAVTYVLLLLWPDMFLQSSAKPSFLIKSLLFIPFDIGGVLQPLMRVGWTINCEIFFYLLFMLAFHISHRYRGLICSCLLVIPVTAAGLLPGAPAPLAFYGNPVMLEFIFGILVYYTARRIYRLFSAGKLPPYCSALALSVAALTFLGLIASKPFVNVLGFRRLLVWGLPALLIVLCFFIWGLHMKKTPASAVLLGDMSFSLYLIHYYPVMLINRLVPAECTPLTAVLVAAAAFAVSVLLSVPGYILVEQKLSVRIRRHLLKYET